MDFKLLHMALETHVVDMIREAAGLPENRRHPRFQYFGVVFVSWKMFDGQKNCALGRCIDVSERGMGLALSARIPVGSFVRVRAYKLNLDCSATVRHVAQQPGGYGLGLQLSMPVDADVLAELSEVPPDTPALLSWQ
jgi:PilZ domain-containing protein